MARRLIATLTVCLAATPALLAAEPSARGGQPIRFEGVATAWNLAVRHRHAGSGAYYMIETMGAGVAIVDYDDDGDEDIFFVDSVPLPGYEGPAPRSRLMRQDAGRDGPEGTMPRFVDVTARSGLDVAVYGMGAVAGDVDQDGDLDLYVTGFGANQLFVSGGDGRFHAHRAGVEVETYSSAAAFGDVDRDGDIDLYVTSYVDFGFDNNPVCGNQQKGIRAYCHPDAFHGVADRFFLNQGPDERGRPRFAEATSAAGLAGADGPGLGAVFADIDGDGWLDLFVANDMKANFLFKNRGAGTDGMPRFEEVGLLAGVALNDRGSAEASMGVAIGDLDGDGGPEIATTHLDNQTNALYGYAGSWLFVDRRYTSRLAEPSIGHVGFGVAFVDLDQDGWLDVAVANGHIIDNIEQILPQYRFEQPNQVFRNQGKGVFAEVAKAGLDAVRSSRGLAAGDLDGDGDLDLVITNSNDLAEVYENRTDGGGFLAVDPRQRYGNRRAVGAKIEAHTGPTVQRRETRAGDSYLSQHAGAAHFGLGDATMVDRLRIVWPGDGKVTEVRGLPADVRVRVVR